MSKKQRRLWGETVRINEKEKLDIPRHRQRLKKETRESIIAGSLAGNKTAAKTKSPPEGVTEVLGKMGVM